MTKKRTQDTRETRANQSAQRARRIAEKTPKAETGSARYSYFDCLRDEVPVPTGLNGTTLYQLLMVGCMVLFVLTASGVSESGASFFAHSR